MYYDMRKLVLYAHYLRGPLTPFLDDVAALGRIGNLFVLVNSPLGNLQQEITVKHMDQGQVGI
jgi:hypothetical protein